jgi:aminopeptidase N
MPSLTAREAVARAAALSVTSYDVALDLTRSEETFLSRTRIAFGSSDGYDTFVDLAPAELHSVTLNGRSLHPADVVDNRLPLTDLEEFNTLEVEATMAYSHDGEGLHRAVDPEDGLAYLYAMAFLPAAPRIFACFDQPDLKARYRLTVRAPQGWLVLGNSVATQVEPGAWSFEETQPLSTYFVTLVAGPYHSIYSEHDGIPLGLHCRQSLTPHLDQDAAELFEVTAACFDEYHRLFGIRYPFGEYHQAFVPEFNAGAMENPGCVTFTDELVFRAQATDNLRAERAMTVAHEMAHQWFGDLVTMRWWDDLWLNESFAEYMGYRVTSEVTQFSDVLVEFALGRKAWGMAADQRRSTHPVAGNGAADAQQALTGFDGISYTKGAATLRQLNAYLGDAAFLAGVVEYLQRHSYGNASFADLIEAWQRASGKDVSAWADAWLRTSGLDTLCCELGRDGSLTLRRTLGSEPPRLRPHALTVTAYGAGGTAESVDMVVTGSITDVPLDSREAGGLVVADSADQTWAKIALDEPLARAAPHLLGTVPDPLARAVVWGALREGLLDGRTSPGDYLGSLELALPDESDLVVEILLGGAPSAGGIGAVGTYFPSAEQRQRLTQLVERILVRAGAGTNRQLITARQLIHVTPDTEVLRRWYDGDVPDGVLLDDDLRWRLLTALCEQGAATQCEIDELLARDRSSQGALHALRARASLPTSETKEQSWQAIMTDAGLSNYAVYALAERFFRPAQDEATGAYVGRYFADIPTTATLRRGWVADRAAVLAYPRYAVSAETVDLAEACLGRDDLAPGIRRAISDCTDDLTRVLASRRSFGR